MQLFQVHWLFFHSVMSSQPILEHAKLGEEEYSVEMMTRNNVH